VHLSVIDGADCLVLERLQTLGGMPLLADTDRRQPSHCTSTGKAIAAFNPSFARARCEAGFPPRTTRSISSEQDFHAALDRIRRTGMAVSEGESVLGITSIGVPVRDGTGVAIAALSIVGPTASMTGRHERLARVLAAAAGVLQRAVAQ
jgi:DNA-binding IclR family transcriptional regulator